MKTTQDKYFLW